MYHDHNMQRALHAILLYATFNQVAFLTLVTGDPCTSPGESINASSGHLSSPNFPDSFNTTSTCTWNITVPSGKIIKLTFLNFTLVIGENIDCSGAAATSARVFITNVASHGGDPNDFQLCGQKLPSPVYSEENFIQARFESRNGTVNKGFNASYKAIEGDSLCPTDMILNDTTGSFSSPFNPRNYPFNQTCNWKIIGKQGYRVELTIPDYNLHQCDAACSCDFFEVQNSFSDDSAAGKLCGTPRSVNLKFYSLHESLRVVFVSDDTKMDYDGFRATYKLLNYSPPICPKEAIPLSGSGKISSTNYPKSNYTASRNCTWIITAPAGEKVKIAFTDFVLSECSAKPCLDSCSYVELYDGGSTNSPSLGRFCQGSPRNRSLFSTGNQMFVAFHPGKTVGRGFEAKYESNTTGVDDTKWNSSSQWVIPSMTSATGTLVTQRKSASPTFPMKLPSTWVFPSSSAVYSSTEHPESPSANYSQMPYPSAEANASQIYNLNASQFESQGTISSTRLISKPTQVATFVSPSVSESMTPAQSSAAPMQVATTRPPKEPATPHTAEPPITTIKPTAPPVDTSNMYPFGPKQNDSEFVLEDSWYYYSRRCLRIDTDWKGFPFFTGRHYKLHICRDGKIQLNYEWSWWWPQKFGIYRWFRNMAVIAPFWATIDTHFAFKKNHSKVYYQVYEENKGSSNEIMAMASRQVQKYAKGFSKFMATWVLVVTWDKLCPYVYYHYYYYDGDHDIKLNCPWSNTFQAVIVTNGFNTFLMYNYPYNGIQWVVPADRADYRYWTGYYGLPVAGWNAGNDGKDYLNIKGSGTLFGMYNLDKQEGNTGSRGNYFWRIENSNEKDSLDKCIAWSMRQRELNMRDRYKELILSDWQMACPCTEWQAWMDWGRFSWDWWSSWPDWCYESRRFKFIRIPLLGGNTRGFIVRQQCCYSTIWEEWGSLKVGPPDGGHVKVTAVDEWFNEVEEMEEMYTDRQAYRFCCVDTHMCEHFYFYRPSDQCSLYRPPPRRWFWGDPHIKTLDDRNYTFNGLGEFVMVDAKEGVFQLQARTKLAQGNTTKATIFSAGAAKEEKTSTIEIRVKSEGGLDILIDGETYKGYDSLTNKSIAIGGNLSASIPEKNCLQVSFPSTTSVNFCVKKEMLSFVVSLSEDFKNTTNGLLGTWNDNPNDDFTIPNGTVLESPSFRDIHFLFGVKWQINKSQSLFTYGDNESVASFSDPNFKPMFADNITWHNDSLRLKAENECGDDHECLFDVASTKDLSVGLVTKDISIQLVNESNKLDNFPPKIETASNAINATLGETVHLSIRAIDNDTITFRVINKPEGAVWNQTDYWLHFTWLVTTSRKFNLTFAATDDKGASASWSPVINMCACKNDGQCVKPEEGDPVNTDSKFIYVGCACQGGYTGRFCDSDIDACEMNGQPCYAGVKCIDLPAPANSSGYKCGPCPSGYTGNGAQCADIDECQTKSLKNCEQLCINLPASFICDCNNGYKLNTDGRTCDDINECLPTNDCMQKCKNTIGNYNCSCDDFFQVDPNNPKKCIAEKPCSSGHGCEHVCFKGKNDKPNCTCNANYELKSDGKSCRDIDECNPSNLRHRCGHICINKPGGYQCSCEKGFELAKDGYDCEDINECLDVNSFNCTDEFHKCVNTRGSYKCECEQDLYFIDGKCRALEKNETAPEPELPKPREPSNKEKKEAVQFSIEPKNEFKWDFEKDKAFKEKMASITTNYCSKNRTRCALREITRNRRSLFFDLYTTDQIHLMPGYPRNSSGLLQIAFYIQQPAGQYVGNTSVLPQRIVIEIISYHESDIETAIGANISGIEAWFKPTSPPSVGTAKPDGKQWKWIVIGVSVGTVLLIVIVSIVIWKCQREKNKTVVIPVGADDTPQENITMKGFHQSVESLQLAPNQ